MADDTRPPAGTGEAFAAYVVDWLDEFIPLIDALVALSREHQATTGPLLASGAEVRDPHLSAQEVADLLGVKPRTVAQWVFRRRLPEPDAAVHAKSLWKRSTILRWAGDTGRLASPALRAEYAQRWQVEPVRHRKGGRIPEPRTVAPYEAPAEESPPPTSRIKQVGSGGRG